jgi:hypothetical protein
MHEGLVEILLREMVSSLPNKKREIYQFIVSLEDELAARSTTSEQFINLLVLHAPHQQAAEHFKLSFGEVLTLMHDIEGELNEKIEMKISKLKWINCSSIDSITHRNQKTFLLIT